MDKAPHIHKKAFIARVNDQRKVAVVDTRYKMIDGKQKLILVLSDGSQKIFEGLRAA